MSTWPFVPSFPPRLSTHGTCQHRGAHGKSTGDRALPTVSVNLFHLVCVEQHPIPMKRAFTPFQSQIPLNSGIRKGDHKTQKDRTEKTASKGQSFLPRSSVFWNQTRGWYLTQDFAYTQTTS